MNRLFLSITLIISSLSLSAQHTSLLIRQGHTAAINQVKYAPDGSAVYSASADHSIKMWDVKTGIDINTFNAHQVGVNCIELSKNGELLVSGDQDGKLMIWNAKTGELNRTINAHEGSIHTIRFTNSDQNLLTGGDDKMLKEWNLEGDTIRTIKGFNTAIKAIGISPDGKRLISGGYKNNGVEMLLVDLDKGKIIDDAMSHVKGGTAAKIYSQAIMTPFAVGINLAKGNVGKGMATFYIMDFSNIEFTNDGTKILISQNTYLPLMAEKGDEQSEGASNISIIELSADRNQFGEVMRPIRWKSNYPRAVAMFNQDQTKVIVNEKFGIKVYDIENADFPEAGTKDATQYVPPVAKEIKGTGLKLNSLAMSSDYRTIVSANDDRNLQLWDYQSGRKIRDLVGFVQPALAVDMMPDGKHILVGSLDRDISIWDITTGQLVRVFKRSSDVCSIDISDDGKYFLTAAQSADFFKLWNFKTGRQTRSFLETKKKTVWVKFTDDSDIVLAATEDGRVKSWSIKEVKVKKKLKTSYQELEDKYDQGQYHISFDQNELKITKGNAPYFTDQQAGVITDAVFSKDSKYLITTNIKGEISTYHLLNKEKTMSMALIGENDFIAYTPDFYYTSSKGAAKAIAFKTGENKVMPFEQLELKYNRPDIIAQRMGYASPKLIASFKAAYDKRLKRLGFDENDLSTSFDLPAVSFDVNTIPYETNQRSFSINITAVDKHHPLKMIQVYVNDVPIFSTKGLTLSGTKKTVSKTLTFDLSTGLNEVKITATNQKGQESISAPFEIQFTAPYGKPDLYVIGIGISEYQQSDYNLAFAAKDAADIITTLSASSAYEQVHSRLLINSDATDVNIMAIREFIQQAKVDDVVAIFIAGHGVLDSQYNYYFATNNIDFNNPSNGGLAYEQLQSLIDGIACRNKILLMDTCHSGELDAEDVETVKVSAKRSGAVSFRSAGDIVQLKDNSFGLKNTLELSKSLFGDMRKGTGATVISAAGGTEFAAEGVNSQNGLFTASFIEGIKTRRADWNRNREYTVSEMRTYVSEQVIKKSKGNQVPTSREENIKNDFRLY